MSTPYVVFTDYEKKIVEYLQKNSYRVYKVNKTAYSFIPNGFDIETFTQYEKDTNGKVISHFSAMYMWQFQFDTITFIGRTWKDLHILLQYLKKYLTTDVLHTLFFIQNQAFEFAFMGKELEKLGHKVEVFARKKRKPMKIIIDGVIEFIDTYLLTGYSLEKIGINYTTTKKLVGDIDYDIPRHSQTNISDCINYAKNDVLILKEYAEYYEKEYLQKRQLPMTKTMIANSVVKSVIKELHCSKDVYNLMAKCFPKSQEEYDYLMTFYSGAYTHGMLCNLFVTLNDFLAYDVVSEYPYVMMSRYYPMGKFRQLNLNNFTKSQIQNFLDKYCCLVECELLNIKSRTGVTVISKNHTYGYKDAVWDNGRLYKADKVNVRITEVDIQTLRLHYDFDIVYKKIQYTERGYLPDYLRLSVAHLYALKDELKKNGMKNSIEYDETKKKLNGLYGACVTKILDTDITFNHGWHEVEKVNDFTTLWRYKNKLPQWGIYITAHARYLILNAVHGIICPDGKNPTKKHNYGYSDTDSIKCKNVPYIVDMFKKLNAQTISNNEKTFIKSLNLKEKYPNTDFSTMGTFDFENHLTRFKCLGSKRYLSEYDSGDIESTVAGLPKKAFLKYCKKRNLDPFDAFTEDGLFISDSESEKLCAYYCDDEKKETITDKNGNVLEVTASSYVSLIPTTFTLEVSSDLQKLFAKMQNYEFLKEKET